MTITEEHELEVLSRRKRDLEAELKEVQARERDLQTALREERSEKFVAVAAQLADALAPKHLSSRCTDENLRNGFLSMEKEPRCLRCALIEISLQGCMPLQWEPRLTFWKE